MSGLGLYTKGSMSTQHRENFTHFCFCSVISNSRLMKSALVCLSRWTDKETGIWTHTTVSSASKKNKIMSHVGTWIQREVHHG